MLFCLTNSTTLALSLIHISRRNTIVYTIIGIIAAILVAALLVWDSGVIQKSMTAVTIGDRKYTAVDVDYYYYSSYSTYANYASRCV